jgi:hypothetical protein
MIYTTREIINRGYRGKGPNSRPASKNAEGDDLWKGAEMGMKPAPLGHQTPCFRSRQSGPPDAKCLFFSDNLAIRRRVGRAPREAI